MMWPWEFWNIFALQKYCVMWAHVKRFGGLTVTFTHFVAAFTHIKLLSIIYFRTHSDKDNFPERTLNVLRNWHFCWPKKKCCFPHQSLMWLQRISWVSKSTSGKHCNIHYLLFIFIFCSGTVLNMHMIHRSLKVWSFTLCCRIAVRHEIEYVYIYTYIFTIVSSSFSGGYFDLAAQIYIFISKALKAFFLIKLPSITTGVIEFKQYWLFHMRDFCICAFLSILRFLRNSSPSELLWIWIM